jgi:hypothetical protein
MSALVAGPSAEPQGGLEDGRGGALSALNPGVRSWRLCVSHQFLAYFPFEEPLANPTASGGRRRGTTISVSKVLQWFIAERLREKMPAIEAVRPDANDEHLIEPWIENLNQAGDTLRSDTPAITVSPRRWASTHYDESPRPAPRRRTGVNRRRAKPARR